MTEVDSNSLGRTSDIRTKNQAFGQLLTQGSLRAILPACLPLLVYRLSVNDFGLGDLAVIGVTIVMAGPVEWVIHRYGLHAPKDSFRTRRLTTSNGHTEHHLDPMELKWVLLPAIRAAFFMPMIALFTALWALPLLMILDGGLAAPFATAVLGAWLSLAHYEWLHLLIHARYRMKSRFYDRLSRNHRQHHYRNENYWLGITSNLGDRIMRTLPASNDAVEISHTARTLEAEARTLD